MTEAAVGLTGVVRIDLTDVEPSRMRNRLASVPTIPPGARLVVVVGALAVEPEAARLLSDHTERLEVEIHGECHAVRRWLEAVRAKGSLW